MNKYEQAVLDVWPSLAQRAYLVGLALGFCIGLVVAFLCLR
jgi:hypothetical protein